MIYLNPKDRLKEEAAKAAPKAKKTTRKAKKVVEKVAEITPIP